jgi:hypothetical protein
VIMITRARPTARHDIPIGLLLGAPFLEIANPVIVGGSQVGTIEAYFDLTPLRNLVHKRILTASAVLLAASLLAWLLASPAAATDCQPH